MSGCYSKHIFNISRTGNNVLVLLLIMFQGLPLMTGGVGNANPTKGGHHGTANRLTFVWTVILGFVLDLLNVCDHLSAQAWLNWVYNEDDFY